MGCTCLTQTWSNLSTTHDITYRWFRNRNHPPCNLQLLIVLHVKTLVLFDYCDSFINNHWFVPLHYHLRHHRAYPHRRRSKVRPYWQLTLFTQRCRFTTLCVRTHCNLVMIRSYLVVMLTSNISNYQCLNWKRGEPDRLLSFKPSNEF